MPTRFLKSLVVLAVLLFNAKLFATTNQDHQLQNFIEKWRIENNIPAVTLSVELPNQKLTTYVSGTTTLNGSEKITANELFGVGSITKTFISATILQLQEQGALNIHDPIGSYFPEYPRWSKITILELLNMTSGIANFTNTATFQQMLQLHPQQQYALTKFIDLAYQQPDDFAPGQGWHYSNTNYYLLGLIINKISHQDLADELQQRFFVPLQLNHTYYSDSSYPNSVISERIHGYLDTRDVSNINPNFYGPAGGMLMNSADIIHWVDALFSPGKILDQQSMQQLMQTTNVPPSPPKPAGARYGLGIYSLDIPNYGLVWWYTGVIDGYSSVFMHIPSKHITIAAQIDRWQNNDFGLLMPQKPFLEKVLKILSS